MPHELYKDRNKKKKNWIVTRQEDFARVKILITIALRFFSVPVLLGKNSLIFSPVCPRGVGQRNENLVISLPPRGVIVA